MVTWTRCCLSGSSCQLSAQGFVECCHVGIICLACTRIQIPGKKEDIQRAEYLCCSSRFRHRSSSYQLGSDGKTQISIRPSQLTSKTFSSSSFCPVVSSLPHSACLIKVCVWCEVGFKVHFCPHILSCSSGSCCVNSSRARGCGSVSSCPRFLALEGQSGCLVGWNLCILRSCSRSTMNLFFIFATLVLANRSLLRLI